jgi:hypothetical protein
MCPAQLLFDIATVDGIASNQFEWDGRGYGVCNHSRRKLWFGRNVREKLWGGRRRSWHLHR